MTKVIPDTANVVIDRDTYMNTREVTDFLQISRQSLYQRIKSGSAPEPHISHRGRVYWERKVISSLNKNMYPVVPLGDLRSVLDTLDHMGSEAARASLVRLISKMEIGD